ncbi:MAG: guanylate cyclase [Bacteriovoracaceae bacterium]|nr:guanylate cyclase [Bacteriovoracaceae bacterium]
MSFVQKNSFSKILLVEDEEAIAKPLTRLLRMSEYDVNWATDGQQALEILQIHPDTKLMLVDIMMPVMNGWQFREAHKNMKSPLNEIPVIFLSADSQSASKAKEMHECFVSKPIDLDHLKFLMKELINKSDKGSKSI